jgi:ubiquitin carboxyl-terminal hydrolase 14
VKVVWGGRVFADVAIDTSQPTDLFRAQLFALTNVPPERQTIVFAGKKLGGDWTGVRVRPGMSVMMMGTADPLPEEPQRPTVFLEDMSADDRGKMEVSSPAGLDNLGNTCYMNSVVQVLRHIPQLERAAKQHRRSDDPNDALVSALGHLFGQLASSGGAPVTPFLFLSALYLVFPDFAAKKEDSPVPMQQDAEECFSRLLTVLDNKLGGGAEGAESLVRRLFAIHLSVEYRCTAVDDVSKGEELVFKLPCHIRKETGHLSSGVLQSMDETVTKFCPALGEQANYEKKQRITRLPAVLTVQMVRFYWKPGVGNKQGNRAKVVKPILFNDTLDLYDMCDAPLQKALKAVRARMEKEEEERLGLANKSGSSGDSAPAPDDEPSVTTPYTGKYRLFAIITHEGYSAEGGHYVAWIKSTRPPATSSASSSSSSSSSKPKPPEEDEWILFDDAKVTCHKFETVKGLARSTGDAPSPTFWCTPPYPTPTQRWMTSS